MTYLYLIRHARSAWNAAGRVQGQADPPLDDVGRKQAQALAARLNRETFDALYSSPLIRARDTAEAIAARHRLIVQYDERLMERRFGIWEGMTGPEIEAWKVANPNGDWWVHGPPGAENRAAIIGRAAAVFGDIVAAYPDQKVAVVSHGGLLSSYVTHLLKVPPDSLVSFHSNNAAISRIRIHDGQVAIIALNDDRHLEGVV